MENNFPNGFYLLFKSKPDIIFIVFKFNQYYTTNRLHLVSYEYNEGRYIFQNVRIIHTYQMKTLALIVILFIVVRHPLLKISYSTVNNSLQPLEVS